jgi:hypothetical protein
MHLILLSDFIQVPLSKKNHHTGDYYFPTHIQFTIVYLLQEYKLNPKNYLSRQ